MMTITNWNKWKIDEDRNNERKYVTIITESVLNIRFWKFKVSDKSCTITTISVCDAVQAHLSFESLLYSLNFNTLKQIY